MVINLVVVGIHESGQIVGLDGLSPYRTTVRACQQITDLTTLESDVRDIRFTTGKILGTALSVSTERGSIRKDEAVLSVTTDITRDVSEVLSTVLLSQYIILVAVAGFDT